jgi:hypothetical protein
MEFVVLLLFCQLLPVGPHLAEPLEAVVNANQQARRSDVRNRE